MNVAIVGSSGYIANFLIEALEKEIAVNRILKIDQITEADEFLELQNPENFNYSALDGIDYVIFTAAISGPDRCASEFEFCWNINVIGTKYFIKEAIARKCKVLFFSSDAVFGDIPGEIYTENSETKAITPYGRMKKNIEDEFRDSPHFKAIRLSYVVSAKDKFVSYCLSCMKNDKEAEVFHPFYRNCIVVSDVVRVVLWFIYHWEEYEPFVLNVAGTELISRVRIVDELNRVFGNRITYTVSKPNSDFFRNRPAITQMQSLYLDNYRILEKAVFSEKIKKELENTEI